MPTKSSRINIAISPPREPPHILRFLINRTFSPPYYVSSIPLIALRITLFTISMTTNRKKQTAQA